MLKKSWVGNFSCLLPPPSAYLFMHQQSDLKRVKDCFPLMSNTFPRSCLPVWSQLHFIQLSISSSGNLYENAPDCFHGCSKTGSCLIWIQKTYTTSLAVSWTDLQIYRGYIHQAHACNENLYFSVTTFLRFLSAWSILPFLELNGTWASLAECENNYCSLSRRHKGHHRVIWGLRTQPGSLLLMSIKLTIAHLFGNCRKCNLQAMQGQSPLSKNVQVAARCRKRLPDTQSKKMWQRSMWIKACVLFVKVVLAFLPFEGQCWCHFSYKPFVSVSAWDFLT